MLTFVNNHSEDVWLAYMFYAPDVCGEYGGFQAIGWYHIAPGQSSVPYANSLGDVNNRYWYVYAENSSRSVVWAGPFLVQVPADGSPFNTCQGIGSTADRQIGLQQFDVGDHDDFTVTLVG
jgi:uncharacterized membrane protein